MVPTSKKNLFWLHNPIYLVSPPLVCPFTDIHRHFLKNVFQDTQTHNHLFVIALYCLTHFFSKIFISDLLVISEPNQWNTCHLNIFKYF